jgi:hypothetical protein
MLAAFCAVDSAFVVSNYCGLKSVHLGIECGEGSDTFGLSGVGWK